MCVSCSQVGIDDFSVITFGSAAVLIKGPDMPWDAASQLALLEQINCRKGEAWSLAEAPIRPNRQKVSGSVVLNSLPMPDCLTVQDRT